MTAITAVKSWSITRLSCRVGMAANGPAPATVPQMASTETRNVTVTVPRWPSRSAARMTSGNIV